MLKPEVYQALTRLAAFLTQRGARVVFVYLPHGKDGSKVGLDDYLAAGHTTDELLSLATTELRKPPVDERDEAAGACPYREEHGGLIWQKPTQNGPVRTPLTNFTARIVADVLQDDGAETTRLFEIEAECGGHHAFTIPAAQFAAMNWPVEHMGVKAILYPGVGTKDHARCGIQMLSGDVPLRRVRAHTGWAEIGGGWAYLHAGGAIGTEEAVSVHLSGPLEHFRLPSPPQGAELAEAVHASLRLLDLLHDGVSFPVFCATYRSVLGASDFSANMAGNSGAFKSEYASLAQQHFGAAMDARHLPAAWTSTDNFLEGVAFSVKDALLVIDDFVPTGTAMDVQRLHSKADRVLRGQGNGAARGRMRADGSLRATRPPRGLILSTGEDVPAGQSLRGRMCIVEVERGQIDPGKLSECQRDGASGLYASAMSAFIAWLAPQYGQLRTEMREEVLKLRDRAAASGLHRRTPEITANLGAGLLYFLRFAVETSVLDKAEASSLWRRGWAALGEAAQAQARHQAASEPTLRFLELTGAALASGKAHCAGPDGGVPEDPDRWGWRVETVGTGEFAEQRWKPLGDRIGWVEGSDLYLQPDAAFNIAKRMGGESGDGIVLAPKTLSKRLKEKGVLQSTGADRGTLTVRRTLGGSRQAVLHLHAATLTLNGGEIPPQGTGDPLAQNLQGPIYEESAQSTQSTQSDNLVMGIESDVLVDKSKNAGQIIENGAEKSTQRIYPIAQSQETKAQKPPPEAERPLVKDIIDLLRTAVHPVPITQISKAMQGRGYNPALATEAVKSLQGSGRIGHNGVGYILWPGAG